MTLNRNIKVEQLRIDYAKNKILRTYSYLNIKSLYSSSEKEFKVLYNNFDGLDFKVEMFPFNDGAIINNLKFNQHQSQAMKLFIEKINNFNKSKTVYITIGFNGIGFWVELDYYNFKLHLQKFIKEYGMTFYFYAFESYGIQIYRAEYCWEVLFIF